MTTAGWQGKFNDGIRMRRVLARKLYDYVRSLRATGQFPYDDDQVRTKDKRKRPKGEPWHLWSRGAAFIGGEKIVGRYYHGETPIAPRNNKKTITIAFGHSKKWDKGVDGMYHYGKEVLEQRDFFARNLTESDVMRIVDEAYNEY
jgi:hypothetical protein